MTMRLIPVRCRPGRNRCFWTAPSPRRFLDQSPCSRPCFFFRAFAVGVSSGCSSRVSRLSVEPVGTASGGRNDGVGDVLGRAAGVGFVVRSVSGPEISAELGLGDGQVMPISSEARKSTAPATTAPISFGRCVMRPRRVGRCRGRARRAEAVWRPEDGSAYVVADPGSASRCPVVSDPSGVPGPGAYGSRCPGRGEARDPWFRRPAVAVGVPARRRWRTSRRRAARRAVFRAAWRACRAGSSRTRAAGRRRVGGAGWGRCRGGAGGWRWRCRPGTPGGR